MKTGIAIASLSLLVITFGYLLFRSLNANREMGAVCDEYKKLYAECISSGKVIDTIRDTVVVQVPKPYPVIDSIIDTMPCDTLYQKKYADSIPYEDLTLKYDITVLGDLEELGFEYRLNKTNETTIIYKDREVPVPCAVKPSVYVLASGSNQGVGIGASVSYKRLTGGYMFSSDLEHRIFLGYRITK